MKLRLTVLFSALFTCAAAQADVYAECAPCSPQIAGDPATVAGGVAAAQYAHASVGEPIFVYKTIHNPGGVMTKTRTFTVTNSPVSSSADLQDAGYESSSDQTSIPHSFGSGSVSLGSFGKEIVFCVVYCH
jgi:hypothetical protein